MENQISLGANKKRSTIKDEQILFLLLSERGKRERGKVSKVFLLLYGHM